MNFVFRGGQQPAQQLNAFFFVITCIVVHSRSCVNSGKVQGAETCQWQDISQNSSSDDFDTDSENESISLSDEYNNFGE